MNLKQYIESGILEAYALGELGDQERREVESNLRSHPELMNELGAIEEAMENLVTRSGQAPAQKVKESVFRSLRKSGERESVVPINQVPITSVWKYATAASLLIAVASSTLAYVFWSNWKRTESDLDARIALSRQMAEDFDKVNRRLDKIEGDMEIYDSPQFRKVVMKGTANAPSAMASVYWNETTHDLYLSIQNLKELAQDQQYQLWAIADGKPVSMGVFDMKTGGLIRMDATTKASAFAITIEPRGGKPTPTMETMQVIGST